MIELSKTLQRVYKIFEESDNSILMGLAHELYLFNPDKTYAHAGKKTYVEHNAFGIDRLTCSKCKKIVTVEDQFATKVVKSFYEFPSQEAVNDVTLLIGKNSKGKYLAWLRKKVNDEFKAYTFEITKEGTIEKFKEKSTSKTPQKIENLGLETK